MSSDVSFPRDNERRGGDVAATQRHGDWHYDKPRWTPENRRRANADLLEALLALWNMVPDQRFGQLVMNLSREPGGFADTWEWGHGRWRQEIQKAWETWAETR